MGRSMTTPGVPLAVPSNPSPNQGQVIPIRAFTREPLPTDTKYPIGFVVVIGKDPSSGTQGDLWYLANFDSSGLAVWKQFAVVAGAPGIDTITTDDGAPAVEPDVNGNVNILGGTGCETSGQGPGSTVTINVNAAGLTWEVVTDATKTIEIGKGYFANAAGGVTFTLPATAAIGDAFAVSAMNADGFTIAQLAGQNIRIGNNVSTTGVAGSVVSTLIGDGLMAVCAVADTSFQAALPPQGNLTVN
jgi:hypothetical protein